MTREEALDFFNTYYPPTGWKDAWSARECAIEALEERKIGKWIFKNDLKQFFCDKCAEPSLTDDDVYIYGMDLPKFCPNCGAKMEEQE